MEKDTPFVPQWSGPIQGHAINSIKKMYPALCAEHEFDDLLQEAYIVFMKCERKYKGTVDNAAWFMSLFRTALQNRLYTLAGKCHDTISLDALTLAQEPVEQDTNFLRQVVRELPSEVQDLLRVFSSPDLPKVSGPAHRRALLPEAGRGGVSNRERTASYRKLSALFALASK